MDFKAAFVCYYSVGGGGEEEKSALFVSCLGWVMQSCYSGWQRRGKPNCIVDGCGSLAGEQN